MDISKMLSLKPALISLVLLAVPRAMAAGPTAPQAYCSNQNTGATFAAVYSHYQSMGRCMDTCKSQYAFAILQYQDCWCSNYIPASQDSTAECSQPCPGYPSDICGNQGQGLFGYIALDKAPSGTAGASSPAQSATSSPSSSTPPPPSSTTSDVSTAVFQTTTTSVTTKTPPVVTYYVTPTPSSSYIPPPPTSTSSSTQSTSTSSSSSSAVAGTPVVHTSVITRSGSVVTQTVTTTPVSVGGDQSSAHLHREGFSSGAVAGIVIGVLLGVAALALAAFLLWRRKKNNDTEGQPGQTRPKRTTSVLSRTGLLSRGRPPSMAEHNYDNDPYTTGQNRQSMMLGAGATIEPSSPLGGSQDNISSRRHSKPLVYDQRLNPSALFANPEANGSRVSMQDQQDYSRPLGIANPDYRASFDSR